MAEKKLEDAKTTVAIFLDAVKETYKEMHDKLSDELTPAVYFADALVDSISTNRLSPVEWSKVKSDRNKLINILQDRAYKAGSLNFRNNSTKEELAQLAKLDKIIRDNTTSSLSKPTSPKLVFDPYDKVKKALSDYKEYQEGQTNGTNTVKSRDPLYTSPASTIDGTSSKQSASSKATNKPNPNNSQQSQLSSNNAAKTKNNAQKDKVITATANKLPKRSDNNNNKVNNTGSRSSGGGASSSKGGNKGGGSGKPIFGGIGSISYATLPNTESKEAFITFLDKEANKLMAASAPITAISISQQVDYTISKNLDKGFLLAAFGDSPVTINIDGISFYNIQCESLTEDSVQQFFNKYKISNDEDNRLDVNINTGGKSSHKEVFTCALVACDLKSSSGEHVHTAYNYKLTLIGVAKNGK